MGDHSQKALMEQEEIPRARSLPILRNTLYLVLTKAPATAIQNHATLVCLPHALR